VGGGGVGGGGVWGATVGRGLVTVAESAGDGLSPVDERVLTATDCHGRGSLCGDQRSGAGRTVRRVCGGEWVTGRRSESLRDWAARLGCGTGLWNWADPTEGPRAGWPTVADPHKKKPIGPRV